MIRVRLRPSLLTPLASWCRSRAGRCADAVDVDRDRLFSDGLYARLHHALTRLSNVIPFASSRTEHFVAIVHYRCVPRRLPPTQTPSGDPAANGTISRVYLVFWWSGA